MKYDSKAKLFMVCKTHVDINFKYFSRNILSKVSMHWNQCLPLNAQLHAYAVRLLTINKNIMSTFWLPPYILMRYDGVNSETLYNGFKCLIPLKSHSLHSQPNSYNITMNVTVLSLAYKALARHFITKPHSYLSFGPIICPVSHSNCKDGMGT